MIVYKNQDDVPAEVPDGMIRITGVRDLDDDSLWLAIEDNDRLMFVDAQLVPADNQDRRYITLIVYADMQSAHLPTLLSLIDRGEINLEELADIE